ncbi:HAD-IA family hydrolase [Akkermansiaceae bacterium]|nr:HAD-IA family hydrolase [Akkermansiaceae bacterium]
MPASINPSAVLFDFDGVILDTEWPIYETYRDLFLEHGQELTLETYVQCIGSDFNTWSPETYLESLTSKTFDWATINPARNVIIREEVGKLDAVPGVREALEHFKKQEIPCAVVSSSSHDWVDGWLEKLGLLSEFTTTVCRGDAPKIKPAPDLYLEAVRRMNLPASECLVIEDSLNGMKSAHAAGCPVVAIPNRITTCIDFSNAEFQFATMTDFLAAQ